MFLSKYTLSANRGYNFYMESLWSPQPGHREHRKFCYAKAIEHVHPSLLSSQWAWNILLRGIHRSQFFNIGSQSAWKTKPDTPVLGVERGGRAHDSRFHVDSTPQVSAWVSHGVRRYSARKHRTADTAPPDKLTPITLEGTRESRNGPGGCDFHHLDDRGALRSQSTLGSSMRWQRKCILALPVPAR